MNEERDVPPVPVPVVREQRAMSEIRSGIAEIFANAGMSPAFPGLIQSMNDAISSPLQSSGTFGETVVKEVGFTLWPDKQNPVVDSYVKPQGRYVVNFIAFPGKEIPQAKVLVCTSDNLSDIEPAWKGVDLYRIPKLPSSRAYMWRLDQLQLAIKKMFPEKQPRVELVRLGSIREDGVVPIPFVGIFSELLQSTLERFRGLAFSSKWEVSITGLGLPVLHFSIDSPREEMKAYCSGTFFYCEGTAAEVERALGLLAELFRNIPNPFNNDMPFGTKSVLD